MGLLVNDLARKMLAEVKIPLFRNNWIRKKWTGAENI